MFCWIISCRAEGGLAVKTLSRDSFVSHSLLSQQFRNEILLALEEMIYFKNTNCVCRWQRMTAVVFGVLFLPTLGQSELAVTATQCSRQPPSPLIDSVIEYMFRNTPRN